MTPEQRAEAERLVAEASPGPLEVDAIDHGGYAIFSDDAQVAWSAGRGNADLLVAARTLLPAALATIDALTAERDSAQEGLGNIVREYDGSDTEWAAPDLDLDLLRKLASGEGGRRTGAMKRAGLLTWEVTPAGHAALEKP